MYLSFLSFILKIINTINIDFQSEKPRLHQILPRISSTYRQILRNYLNLNYATNTDIDKINTKDPSKFLPLESVYFGVKVQDIIENNQIDKKELHNFRLNCLNFYIELASQIKQRFPFGNDLYKKLTWIDPVNIFSDKKKPSIIPLVKYFPNMIGEDQYEDINNEWRMLSELSADQFNKNMDLESFVVELGILKNALEENAFPYLYTFLKNILCLPHGSAAAERIFSGLNLIKRKNRNLLETSTCHNLLLTKELLRQTTCWEWQPPPELTKKKFS